MAAAVDRVRRDGGWSAWLVDAGRRRLGDFAADATRRRFVEVLSGVAGREPVVA